MTLLEIILTAISLSLDAVAVSVAAGALQKLTSKQSLKIALFFGGFQFLMPIIGWFLGYNFAQYLSRYGSFVGFTILFILGSKMFYGALKKTKSREPAQDITNTKILTTLAVATSIDALVIGITFTFIRVNIPTAASIIGLITFFLCLLGIYIGKTSRKLIGAKIELFGAAILILLAFKILLFS